MSDQNTRGKNIYVYLMSNVFALCACVWMFVRVWQSLVKGQTLTEWYVFYF